MGSVVLLAEDDDDLRYVIAEALRVEGHEVIEASDEREWTDVLDSEVPIDLIVTDVGMPGRHDGLDLARLARSAEVSVPVIIMSGTALNDLEGIPADVGYLAKPFGLVELVRYVEYSLPSARKSASK